DHRRSRPGDLGIRWLEVRVDRCRGGGRERALDDAPVLRLFELQDPLEGVVVVERPVPPAPHAPQPIGRPRDDAMAPSGENGGPGTWAGPPSPPSGGVRRGGTPARAGPRRRPRRSRHPPPRWLAPRSSRGTGSP